MRTRSLIMAGLLAATGLGGAVVARAQTPFALESVGQRLAEGDARMLGRGGWGLTIADSLHPGFKNAASTAWVRHVSLSLTGYGETGSHEDGVHSRSTSRTYLPDVRLAVPLRKGELSFSTGFKLERSSGWHTSVDSTWVAWDGFESWGFSADTLGGNVQFEREGSVFKVPLALAWRATPALAGAVALNLERGSLRESIADYYLSPTTAAGVPFYRSVIAVGEDQFSGTSATLSALFTPRPDLRLGVTWTGSHTVDARRKAEVGGVAARSLEEFEITRPSELAVGVSAPLGGRWEAGLDYRRQDWGRFAAPAAWLAQPDWQEQLGEELQWGFGLERRRGTVRRGGWSNLPLRVGAGWHRWPYRVGGNEVVERTISVGTGFPLRGEGGTLDVALSWGQVGDEAENGLSSSYLRLAVSVTGLEAWW